MALNHRLLIVVAVISSAAQAEALYVDDDADLGGDGSSWGTAFRFLQDALANAVSGTEIRVAQGTYKPDQDEAGNVTSGDRAATFQLLPGVALLGGYAGIGAPDPDARDIDLYLAILCGDLLENDGPDFAGYDENSYHVITGSFTDETAVLDGFTVTAGNAFGSNEKGGGMLNFEGSPTVRACTFSLNLADEGGALYNGSDSAPTLASCTFSANKAVLGGAIVSGFNSLLSLRQCVFSANYAEWGGGAMELFLSDDAVIEGCVFVGNVAVFQGGALWAVLSDDYTITDCVFVDNTAGGGGAIYSGSFGLITDSAFCDNVPTHIAGDWIDNGGNSFCPLCDDSAGDILIVPDDHATIQAAVAAACDGAEVIVGPGTYLGSVNFGGKAIVVRSSHGPEVTTIDAQGAGYTVVFGSAEGPDSILDGFGITGGGMLVFFASPTVRNCRVSGNASEVTGGGMLILGSPTITNCLFADNSTERSGGGISVATGSPTITNCTFSNNTAAQGGGGMKLDAGTTVQNCIVWGNSPVQIIADDETTTLAYCNVQSGWPGPGNIDADPMFVDPDNGDFRLSPGSPCIDAGHNWGVAPDVADLDGDGDTAEMTPFDLDGNPRFVHAPVGVHPGCGEPAVVDMGAYEFPEGTAVDIRLGDIDGDGVVGVIDALLLLDVWGPCTEECCLADFDLDGTVGVIDFLRLLRHWG